MITGQICVGNAVDDSLPYRGWLVGHFVDPADGIRQTDAVEVRWTRFPAGSVRPEWVRGEVRTTIVMLVSGCFRLRFSAEPNEVVLRQPGEYAMWGPGIDHQRVAIDDSIIVVVRWPSLAGHDGGTDVSR